MKKVVFAPLFAILALFYLSSITNAAEDSPFGNLSSEENNLRTVFGTENQNLDTYLDVVQSYNNLNELYERAFGTRKEELSLQLVARAKDVLVSKTGVVLNYTQDVLIEVEKTGRISEEELQILSTSAADLRSTALGYEEEIDSKITTEELNDLSETYNEVFISALGSVKLATIQLSVARGEFLIEQMQREGDLIQMHLDSSANVGGSVEPIQGVFNDGMLDLEEAKTKYQETTAELSGVDFEGGKRNFDALLNRIVSANRKVSSGHGSLKNVLSSLGALYSQSPWQINQDGGQQ